jgi:hypothetical protein
MVSIHRTCDDERQIVEKLALLIRHGIAKHMPTDIGRLLARAGARLHRDLAVVVSRICVAA